MRAALNSTLSASFNSLILVLFGLIIARCLCLPTLGGILEKYPTDIHEYAESVKWEMCQQRFSSVEELGRAICGKRAGSDGGQSHNLERPEATALFLSALQSDVLNPLQIPAALESMGFTVEVAKDLKDAIFKLGKGVANLMEKARKNAKQPPDLAESAGIGLVNAEDGDLAASDFLKKTKEVMEILRKSKCTHFRPQQQELDAPRKQMALDHLNDALVNFLIILERHNIASRKWLVDLLDSRQGVEIIFNYLAHSHFSSNDLGYTGWQWLERLHLTNQMSAVDRRFDGSVFSPKNWKEAPVQFLYLTSLTNLQATVNSGGYQGEMKHLLGFLAEQIDDVSKPSGEISITSPPIMKILSLKVLHSMVRFLGRYHLGLSVMEQATIPTSKWPKEVEAQQFQNLDSLIMFFSGVIKSVYFQHGQSMQELVSYWNLDDPVPMIYLSDIQEIADQPMTPTLVGQKMARYQESPDQLRYFGPMMNKFANTLRDTPNPKEARDPLDRLKPIVFLDS
ncbi:hypothetical protein PtA15_8A718 [Puccinia triticina]|uniref:Uncharacterized protein n=1 Tax=Puccinia triticina TaxID=208348 RepID=A0ABY7CRB2_9BASI|nr:uncharacterized protein PtA15_8A718 [Puccinia triticina]WAQ87811.1 hypothetical protein PtA15_8A718 [Puccinia triticina]